MQGTNILTSREVCLGAIRPAFTYGAVAWYRPVKTENKEKGIASTLQKIPGRCLRTVAGACKATATEALEAELEVEPLDLYTATTILTQHIDLNRQAQGRECWGGRGTSPSARTVPRGRRRTE